MPGLKQAPPERFTRAEFVRWMLTHQIAVYVWPYDVVPCACGDRNCHGWRLVVSARERLSPIPLAEQEAHA